MKKRSSILALALVLILTLAGCECKHQWTPATCTNPKTCTKCGKTEGEALGHIWMEADCVAPKTCERCGTSAGEALGHDWKEADCEHPKTCRRCGLTEGEALGHSWTEATCSEPRTCERCGAEDGEALGHDIADWIVKTPSTCSKEGLETGTCARCGEIAERPIEKLPHKEGSWKIVRPATSSEKGLRQITCTICGEVLKEEEYELTAEEKAAAFKKECKSYDYNTIARNPNDYLLEKGKFGGRVIQVIEDGNDYILRVAMNGSYSSIVFVTYTAPSGSDRILDDDYVNVYGLWMGTKTYESTMGGQITIPWLAATSVDIR